MIPKIIGFLDFLPGWKVNSGAAGLVVTALFQFLGFAGPWVDPTKEVLLALITYGLAMKALRSTAPALPSK